MGSGVCICADLLGTLLGAVVPHPRCYG